MGPAKEFGGQNYNSRRNHGQAESDFCLGSNLIGYIDNDCLKVKKKEECKNRHGCGKCVHSLHSKFLRSILGTFRLWLDPWESLKCNISSGLG